MSGTDTNTGKAGAPFKTLGKAFTAVPTGAAVHLLDGTYDAVSEGSAAPLTVPDGVIVRAENVRKATIAGLTVAADGTMISVYDVVFDLGSVLRAKNVAAAGKVLISGCQFVHRQTSHAVLNVGGLTKLSLTGPLLSGVISSDAIALADDADVAVVGGTIDAEGNGQAVFGGGLITINGRAALSLDGVTMKNSKTPGIIVNGATAGTSAKLTIKNGTVFDAVGSGGNCASGASVIALANATVVVDKATMKNSPGAALCVRSNAANVSLTVQNGASLSGNAVGIASELGAGATAAIAVSDSTLSSNANAAINWQGAGTISVTGSTMAGNGSAFFLANANPLSVTVRKSAVTGNGYGLQFFVGDIAGFTIDLGSAASAGANTFTGNTSTSLKISTPSGLTVGAQGNTWNASVQGADATGHYGVGTVVTAPGSGTNYQFSNFNTIDF